jgi:hypothetical protein
MPTRSYPFGAPVEVVRAPLSIGDLFEAGGRYHAFNAAIAASASDAVRELQEVMNRTIAVCFQRRPRPVAEHPPQTQQNW